MKRISALTLVGILLISACGSAEEEPAIVVHEPWARAAAQGENGAVYLILHNHAAQADELVGASTEVAESVEMHESRMDENGVMSMELHFSIPLAMGAEIEFAPGGFHFMLVNMKEELRAGDEMALTLHFEHHEDITITIPVMHPAETNGASVQDHGTP